MTREQVIARKEQGAAQTRKRIKIAEDVLGSARGAVNRRRVSEMLATERALLAEIERDLVVLRAGDP